MVDKKSHRSGKTVFSLILKVGFEEGRETFGVLETNNCSRMDNEIARGGRLEQFLCVKANEMTPHSDQKAGCGRVLGRGLGLPGVKVA